MDGIHSVLRFLRRSKKTTEKAQAAQPTRKRDLFLAFAVVSLPPLAVALTLLAFVFYSSERVIQDPSVATPDLPFIDPIATNSYYTQVVPGSFLLVGSWASNVAELVVAPFMVLFSYTVARELLQHPELPDSEISDARPPLLREVMRGAYAGIWHWGADKTSRKSSAVHQRPPSLHVIDVAAFGLLTASLFTLMIIVGDNWLHVTTHSTSITMYNASTNYTENGNNDTPYYQAGFSPLSICNDTLTTPLPSNISSADLPCSLNETQGLTNVANARFVYLTLDTGISQLTSDFNNGINYTTQIQKEDNGTATQYQIVTYPVNGSSHSLFFYPDASAEFGLGLDLGIDYVANSTSMVTQCTFATQECNIRKVNTGNNNISIPFHCYDDFSGDLGQTPATGHERAQGWNMSFYEPVDGSPQNIPVQAQSNPFHFYAATAINSINLQDYKDQSDLPESTNGSIVDAGRGFTAFALNCEATVYDVTFSIINGSFAAFNATKSSPQKASIIKAPLQVGFGQYRLYEDASLAVLATNSSVDSTMAVAFSQTGMALASGVFDNDNNIEQRFRWTVDVTKVQKAPFYYLVVVCLLYSAFGIVMTVAAFCLRRVPKIREQQAVLMVEWGPGLRKMYGDGERKSKERGERKSEDSRSRYSGGMSNTSIDGFVGPFS